MMMFSTVSIACVGLLTVYGFETRLLHRLWSLNVCTCVGLLTVYGFETPLCLHEAYLYPSLRRTPYRLRF